MGSLLEIALRVVAEQRRRARTAPADGAAAPSCAPAGIEYEPGQDWDIGSEAAPVLAFEERSLLVYLPGEQPAWCVACGVELVNPKASDGRCGPCRWQAQRSRQEERRS